MSGTIVPKKKVDAVYSSPPGDEKHYQEILAPVPFHEKLKKIDGLGSPEEAELMAIEIVGTDLEHRIVVGAFLFRVKEKELHEPGTFADWVMDNLGMRLRHAEYYMKVSGFVLQANFPGEKLARLKWSHYRVLASRIEPSDLSEWLEPASEVTVPELEEFFKRNRSADARKLIEWVAERAGGDWAETARPAAPNPTGDEDAGEQSIGTQLLADIEGIFSDRDVDRLASKDLCRTLAGMEGRPWPEWRDARPITTTQLARLLAPYEIRPKTIRLTNEFTSKGYLLADFGDAFARDPSRQSEPGPRVCVEKAGAGHGPAAIGCICGGFPSPVPGDSRPATLKDLFRRTLNKHGDDESAAVATIIGEFKAAFPKWTIHAEAPGGRSNGKSVPRDAIREVEIRLKNRPRNAKKMNGAPAPDFTPSSTEPAMNDRRLEYFRRKLLDWRHKLHSDSNDTLQRLQEGGTPEADVIDRAAAEAECSLDLRARDRARKLIPKIEEALQRIDNGTYGYCEQTGEPIGLSRLRARPIATLSIEAQERHERMEKTQLSRSDQMAL